MNEYKISRASKRCATGKRPLQPGEIFFSVVMEENDELVRHDIAAEHWNGPPEEALGWWKNRVPPPQAKRRQPAPPELLLELLRSLADHPERTASRYLLALICLRKRIVRSRREPCSPGMLSLESVIDGEALDVPVVTIAASQADRLAAELDELTHVDV